MKFLLVLLVVTMIGLMGFGIYSFCKERDPSRIGTVEIYNDSTCTSRSTYYTTDSKGNRTSHSSCNGYVCQQITKRIGKHVWNDEVLNIKDLYSGECRTNSGGW